jgi:hypothetical protein
VVGAAFNEAAILDPKIWTFVNPMDSSCERAFARLLGVPVEALDNSA